MRLPGRAVLMGMLLSSTNALATNPQSALATGHACPTSKPGSDIHVSVVSTGVIRAPWSTVVNDGRTGQVELPLLVGVIKHPDGTVLVDAGLGQTTRNGTFPRFPLNNAHSVVIPPGWTIAERLESPPKRVLMTHLHYDHVGGLFDLPGVEVWTTEAEWASTMTGNLAFPESRIRDAVNWQIVPLRAGRARAMLNRPATDVLGDGSIWYISTPGHTPGSASVLVQAEDKAWLFIGDSGWIDAHLGSARRPWMVSLLVDARSKQLRKTLDWIRDLMTQCPGIEIVAGHEMRWGKPLPTLPAATPLR